MKKWNGKDKTYNRCSDNQFWFFTPQKKNKKDDKEYVLRFHFFSKINKELNNPNAVTTRP